MTAKTWSAEANTKDSQRTDAERFQIGGLDHLEPHAAPHSGKTQNLTTR